MLSLLPVGTRREKRSFVDFVYRVYAGNPCYKDTLMPILKFFLYQRDSFTSKSYVRPIQVVSRGEVAAQCVLVHHPRFPMLQVAFFDALPDRSAAVELLIEEARAEARRRGLRRIVAGLNGHVWYGVGYLADGFDLPCPFDSMYTPDYYLAYWSRHAEAVHTLSTYHFDFSEARPSDTVLRRAYSTDPPHPRVGEPHIRLPRRKGDRLSVLAPRFQRGHTRGKTELCPGDRRPLSAREEPDPQCEAQRDRRRPSLPRQLGRGRSARRTVQFVRRSLRGRGIELRLGQQP
ncbi:MAG: hypothetical protein P8049_13000 [Gemmatimonadota bacterium]